MEDTEIRTWFMFPVPTERLSRSRFICQTRVNLTEVNKGVNDESKLKVILLLLLLLLLT